MDKDPPKDGRNGEEKEKKDEEMVEIHLILNLRKIRICLWMTPSHQAKCHHALHQLM